MDHNKRDTADVTLNEARRVVDHLSPADQARLLMYLAPRIAQYVAEMESPAAASLMRSASTRILTAR